MAGAPEKPASCVSIGAGASSAATWMPVTGAGAGAGTIERPGQGGRGVRGGGGRLDGLAYLHRVDGRTSLWADRCLRLHLRFRLHLLLRLLLLLWERRRCDWCGVGAGPAVREDQAVATEVSAVLVGHGEVEPVPLRCRAAGRGRVMRTARVHRVRTVIPHLVVMLRPRLLLLLDRCSVPSRTELARLLEPTSGRHGEP